MKLTDKNIEDFQKIYREKFGVDLNKQDAHNKAFQLVHMMEILRDSDREEQSRRLRLKKEPKGFPITIKGATCPVCRTSIDGEGWYDQYGLKCSVCQKAMMTGIIPKFVFTDRSSWYSFFDLDSKFGINAAFAKKLIKENKIKALVIPDKNGKPHEQIFLKRDNPKLAELDPTVLTSGIRKISQHKANLREKQLQEWLKKN